MEAHDAPKRMFEGDGEDPNARNVKPRLEEPGAAEASAAAATSGAAPGAEEAAAAAAAAAAGAEVNPDTAALVAYYAAAMQNDPSMAGIDPTQLAAYAAAAAQMQGAFVQQQQQVEQQHQQQQAQTSANVAMDQVAAYTAATAAGMDPAAAVAAAAAAAGLDPAAAAQAVAEAQAAGMVMPPGYMAAAQMAADGSRLEAARAAGSAVTLAVRMDGMAEPAALEVPLYSTVAELKRRISAGTGNLLPPGRMQLLSETGELMADGTLLTAYSARDGYAVSLYIMANEEPQDEAAVAAAEAEAAAYHQQALAIQQAMAAAAAADGAAPGAAPAVPHKTCTSTPDTSASVVGRSQRM